MSKPLAWRVRTHGTPADRDTVHLTESDALASKLRRELDESTRPIDRRRVVEVIQLVPVNNIREQCAVAAWNHFMDVCILTGRAPAMWSEWCAASAIRAVGNHIDPTKDKLATAAAVKAGILPDN